METIEAILTRRSTRRFRDQMPDRSLVEQVIECGRHAPSGSNSQTSHFIVLADKDRLKALAEIVQAEFAQMEIGPDTYISLKNSVRASQKGAYVFHYNTPVLIVVANRKGYGNAMADSACALENMMIAANALGLGSCWINQLHWLDESKAVRAFMEELGLEEDETICGSLALGFAATGEPLREALKRTGNPVTWVE